MSRQEAYDQYVHAQKLGRKCVSECNEREISPYPAVLDEILDGVNTVGSRSLGLINIPIELIVGTKTSGRVSSFAANFMPLLSPDTEFGTKWISLCEAHLDAEGIRDPIDCYEYMGRFYVQEGNKRVSVLKSFDCPSVLGTVTRILPEDNGTEEAALYYEFLDFYRLSKLYNIFFRKRGSYKLLQAALGYDADHVWSDNERHSFSSLMYYIRSCTVKLEYEPDLAGDITLALLKLFSFSELKEMTAAELSSSIEKILPEIRLIDVPDPIDVSTAAPETSKDFFSRFINSISAPSCLNVAFINEFSPKESPWIMAHEQGRRYIEEKFGDRIKAVSYTIPSSDAADSVFEEAVKNGADVIFATTPSLIAVSRRAALNFPGIKILNCSVSMPFPEVRTYYSRMYEGKFISGAIAGAMTKTGRLGYIAPNPIYGVPAAINAFALGASLTNPDARVFLRWTSVSIDTISELKALGVDMISNRDVPMYTHNQDIWGLSHVDSNGVFTPICSPYWNWGEMYSHIIQLILDGAWNSSDTDNPDRAINYWFGMNTGAVDMILTENIPEGIRQLVHILKSGLSGGSIMPFKRRIYSQDGTLVNDGVHSLSADEILRMDWLCNMVDGSIPEYDELLPIAKNIVALQGIYRERIVPEKGRVML